MKIQNIVNPKSNLKKNGRQSPKLYDNKMIKNFEKNINGYEDKEYIVQT